MTIQVTKIIPTSNNDIDNIESILGRKLPLPYKEFILLNNGGKLSANLFKSDEGYEGGIEQFIPISEIMEEAKNIDYISEAKIPIAWVEGGNYLLLDLNSGVIHYWDHEVQVEQPVVASSIEVLIKQLEPFDPNAIEVKEGQVKSAWIDPDFLKNI